MLPPNEFWDLWWVKGWIYGMFAAVGGALGHLLRTIDKNENIVWWRTALEGLSAGFVGLLVFMGCDAADLGPAWTGVTVGVAGWLGANTSIRMLEKIVYKKFGIGE